MNTVEFIERLAAAPKPWLASVTLPNGDIRTMRQPRESMARSWALRLHDKYDVPFTVEYRPE